ncbi:MAG: hypothetical protein KIT35_19605 [Piscinibacter sp.]|uniref:hypothetical protein n=1 Tax=Piscinibacter sp. TaxID=1903157 RepID=UPI00258EBD39|nr:hypothetical protein [Piscinibacter sp.]MCW5666042.1 hypothetical protein [Piscinibacter sp.]
MPRQPLFESNLMSCRRRCLVLTLPLLLGRSAFGQARPAVQLGLLVDGSSTLADCIGRLGPPGRQFAAAGGGVVFTYRLGEDGTGLHPVETPESWFDYQRRRSLVLVFDSRGTLTRHALVKVRGD